MERGQIGTGQIDRDRQQGLGQETVAEQGVSDEKDLLILIKTVFAKLDSRLG